MSNNDKTAIREYVEPPKFTRMLHYGISGPEVKVVQEILLEEGFFTGTPLGNFRDLTKSAVQYFQGTHLDRDGRFLLVDGVVGPKTWWSLHNASGSAQRSYIDTEEQSGDEVDSDGRMKVLEFFRKLHGKGIREIPNGSNYGDGVEPIVKSCGFKYGIAWCLAVQSYAELECFNEKPLGAMHVHCSTFWNEAAKWGRAFRKGRGYRPIPGDIAIYNYRNAGAKVLTGPGHAVRVARVSADGQSFNTFGGNEGNRLKYALRRTREGSLVGFVNLFEDEKNPPKFTPGITHAPTTTLKLSSTR